MFFRRAEAATVSSALFIPSVYKAQENLSLLDTPKFRGERNNNPGNLRNSPEYTWIGEIGSDAQGFVVFDTAENGLRALGKDLLTKAARGLNTIEEIVAVYAPSFENDVQAYIRALEKFTGFGRGQLLQLTDSRVLITLMEGIVRHENGRMIYPDSLLARGAERALS